MIIADKAAVQKKQEGGKTEEPLHYANVDFAKLQARSGGELGAGEIRGLASKTAEYAEVRLHCRGSANEEDAKADEACVDTYLEQGKDDNGLSEKVIA